MVNVVESFVRNDDDSYHYTINPNNKYSTIKTIYVLVSKGSDRIIGIGDLKFRGLYEEPYNGSRFQFVIDYRDNEPAYLSFNFNDYGRRYVFDDDGQAFFF